MKKEQQLSDALIAQVRVELAERNMYQKDLAAAMGIDPAALNRYFKARRGISLDIFIDMAAGLGMDPWVLMKLVEERAANKV